MEAQITQIPEEDIVYVDRNNFFNGVIRLTKKLFML